MLYLSLRTVNIFCQYVEENERPLILWYGIWEILTLLCGPDKRSPSHQIHLIRFMIVLVLLTLCLYIIRISFIPKLYFTRPPWFLKPQHCGCICRYLSGVPAGTLLAT